MLVSFGAERELSLELSSEEEDGGAKVYSQQTNNGVTALGRDVNANGERGLNPTDEESDQGWISVEISGWAENAVE